MHDLGAGTLLLGNEAQPRSRIDVALSARAVGMTYRTRRATVRALSGIELDAMPGSFTSLIGPSGCGKSTLLRMFADLVAPTEGEVRVNGYSPAEARERRLFSMVFQQPNLMPWRSVRRNMTMPLELMRLPQVVQRERCDELLAVLGLEEFADSTPDELSGGMQQRVAIGRALIVHPKILFMDEPFGALDEITRERLNDELLRVCSNLDITVLFVTHSISEAVYLSTDVLVLSARPGRIIGAVPIDFGYPRDPGIRRETSFFACETEVRDLLHLGTVRDDA